MLTEEEVKLLREELATAKNPLFFHDDDADGLASFLLLYRIHKEGRNIPVKASPNLDSKFFRKIDENNPDKIFILDIAQVEQEFIDYAKRPIFWIDHHGPFPRQNVHYFNPRKKDPDAYVPTTRMAWQVSENPEDMWIAAAGCLADWYIPEFLDEFIARYPTLLPQRGNLPTMVFKQPVGKLIKLFFFLQKGPSSEVHKSIKIMMRIQSPEEILEEQSAQGKWLHKRFLKINAQYEQLLAEARKQVKKGPLLLFHYTDNQWSFTANLANELAALYPQKVIIIAREKSGEMKCSLRAQFPIVGAMEKALVGIEGRGGGHPNACGLVVKKEDWERFLENFKRELKGG